MEPLISQTASHSALSQRRIILGIQYDGTPWQGWQTQPHGLTVQDQLEAALKQFTVTTIKTSCAGRTDTGVHALEQVVHFDTDIIRDRFSWVRGVNTFLPASIAVRWAYEIPAPISTYTTREAADRFHARLTAIARTYYYVIYNHPIRSPLLSGKAGWVFVPLDIQLMQRAIQYLLGRHDFTAFRAAECQARSALKTIQLATIRRYNNMIIFTLKADAFLQHMVRNIVAALVAVGKGKQPPEWIAYLLKQKDRNQAAPTFMPDGLYLARVDYPEYWQLPQEVIPLVPLLGIPSAI